MEEIHKTEATAFPIAIEYNRSVLQNDPSSWWMSTLLLVDTGEDKLTAQLQSACDEPNRTMLDQLYDEAGVDRSELPQVIENAVEDHTVTSTWYRAANGVMIAENVVTHQGVTTFGVNARTTLGNREITQAS